jgi:hypothetical protein
MSQGMQAAQGPVHIAGLMQDGSQHCSRCHAKLADSRTMVPGDGEAETFPEGAYVLEVSEDRGGGLMEAHLVEIDVADMGLGAYLMCGESGWDAEIARQDAE